MSRESLEQLVRRGYTAMRNRDLHAVLEMIDPEFEGTFRILEVEGETYRGHEGMRRFAEEVWSVFPDWLPEVMSARDLADDVLVVHVQAAGRGVGSGVEVDFTAWQIVKVRDGRISSMRAYETEAEALEAVGLREKAMSQGKLESAERVFDAVNKRDWGALSEIVDPDLEFQSVFSGMEGHTFRGATGIAEVFEEIDATWADVMYEVEGLRDAGESSVVLFRVVGKARGSGIPLDERLAQVWTWRSGRPYRVETFSDRRKALKAVGLSE